MLYHNIERKNAIDIIAKDFGCTSEKLLIIPQWSYHLDLQMAYLGQGQFIIHSFDQHDFDFDLTSEELEKSKKTFEFLRRQFETDIVDKICKILTDHHFSVKKVFGCLFYLNDVRDKNELQYVPYCKNSEGCDGSLAFLMNGFAAIDENDEKYFLTARCENKKFKKLFENSLAELGRKVEYIDMLDFYDEYGNFDNILSGCIEAHSVSEYIAFMNGGLRCQTSVLNEGAIPNQLNKISPSIINRYNLMYEKTEEDLDIIAHQKTKLKK